MGMTKNTVTKDPKSVGLTDLFRNFKGTWVAMKDDGRTVICAGDSASEVKEKAKEMGFNNPILTCLVS